MVIAAENVASESYDAVPYPAFCFRETHPHHLHFMASLFGLDAPLPAKARVLEIGCASGANIIPMAATMPQASFVGIDVSKRQIDAGLALVSELKLKNIRLEQRDLAEIRPEFGTYDYIICHGVFSWVPEKLQAAILSLCSKNLAPNGVAYVSYNTLPGWNMYRSIRDMMLYHTHQFTDPKVKVQQARAFLDFAVNAVRDQNNAYSLLLRQEMERLRAEPDGYLLHDHLEANNHPMYFHDFMRLADVQGLRYLADAIFHSMTPAEFAPEVREVLNKLASQIVPMEQYLDFLRNRTFRATLLCHKDRNLRRRIEPADIRKLSFASAARLVPAGSTDSPGESCFRLPRGGELRTKDPFIAALLRSLGKVWPSWKSLEVLKKEIPAELPKDAPRVTEPQLCEALLGLFQQGVVEIHPEAMLFTTAVSQRPSASPLARAQAQRGPDIANLRHELMRMPDAFRFVLHHCDGTRDVAALAEALDKAVEGSVLQIREGVTVPSAPAERRAYFEDVAKRAVQFLAQSALLMK